MQIFGPDPVSESSSYQLTRADWTHLFPTLFSDIILVAEIGHGEKIYTRKLANTTNQGVPTATKESWL